MHRFFVPFAVSGESVTITDRDLLSQMTRVLRLQAGNSCTIFDGSGYEFACEVLRFGKEDAELLVTKKSKGKREVARDITLYQALLKGDHFELVLQKATELGVSSIVPVVTDRTIVRDISENKMLRYRHILKEATEQSGGVRIPQLHEARDLLDAIGDVSAASAALCYEGGGDHTLTEFSAKKKAVSIFVGPEGGFTDDEVALAKKSKVSIVTLSPRILRAETAGIIACAYAASA